VKLEAKADLHHEARQGTVRLHVRNPGAGLAFLVHARLTRGKDGDDLVPIFWDDNYFSLLPGKEKTVTATYDPGDLVGKEPVLELDGFNIEPAIVKVSR